MSDIHNNLILTILNSPWTKPEADVTSPVLLSHTNFSYPFHESVDNNFIYLKGEMIYSANTSGNVITLYKVNDNNIEINLSPIVNDINDSIKSNSSDVSNLSDLFNSYTSTTESELSEINEDITNINNTFNSYTSVTETTLNDINEDITNINNTFNSYTSVTETTLGDINEDITNINNTFNTYTSTTESELSDINEDITNINDTFNAYTSATETELSEINKAIESIDDVYVNQGNVDVSKQKLIFTNTNGETFEVTNASALFTDNDIHVVSGVYEPSTGIVTYTTNVGTAFGVSGFTTGMTDSYTTAANLYGETISFDNNVNGDGLYSVDLSSMLQPLKERLEKLENAEDADTFTESSQLNSNTLNFTRNDGVIYSVDLSPLLKDLSGRVTDLENAEDADTFTQSASLSNNTLTFTRNDAQTYTVDLSPLNSADNDWTVDGSKMYSLPSGNVGIGTASPSEKLHVAGNVRGDSFSTYGGSTVNGNPHTRILHPYGASYSESGSVTGSIGIDLPQGYTNTMLNFKVKVFDYTENEHITINIAGYTYKGDGTNSKWYNTTAWVEGSPKDEHNFKVRFGYDKRDDKCTIFIGEETSTWSYPKVYVTDVHVGNSNSTPDKWNDGWTVWFIRDWSTLPMTGGGLRYKIDEIQQNTQVNNWVRNSDNSIEYKNGNAKILGGNSLTINTYTLPSTDGAIGQVLKTNGSGVVTWQNDNDTDTTIWSKKGDNAYYNIGNVGIGTDSPGSKLQINGSDFNDSAIRFLNNANSNPDYWMIGSRSFSSGADGFEIGRNFGSATGGDSTGGKLYITNGGNVSIGNGYQPTQKLEVAGNILADGGLLKVENNSRTFSVGPENTSWTHFRTNSTNGFYFYRPISIKENINGEVFKSENNFITVKHDRAKLEIQNKYTTNQHPGLLITDINGDETFRVVTEVEEGTGLGVRSKVESKQGDLWLASQSNTIEMIPNSSDNAWPRRSTFESNGNFTLRGTIKIEGGNPGAGKVLTSDGVGNATWQTPTSDGTASSNQFAGVGTPVGSVIMWSTNSAPTGWLICDGSWLKKDDYLELYNVIGETYSPNGLRVSNGYIEFQLPDLRSRIPVGYNSSDSNFNDIGKKGGASTHTLTENQIPHKKHRHSIGSGQDSNGNPKSDSASEHFHAISWVRDSSGEGDTLTNDQAKSVIDLFNSRKLNANGSEENWAMKLYNDFVGIVNDAGEYVSSQTNVWAVYNPFSEWDPSNANWVYTGIHKYGPTSNTGGVSNLEAIQQGKVIPDGAHGHSSEFMSTGVAESNPGGSAHNNLQPYIVMNYIICANAVEPTGTGPAEPGGEQQTYN
jgi:microcystin-dependent protein